MESTIDLGKNRFPYCIVWTPIPILSWIIPILGHIGIATSTGIIRDFPYPYHVGTDKMAFGGPTKYWKLSKDKAFSGEAGWDAAVTEASHIYRKRMNYFFFENSHSHVSKALNLMQYDGSSTWRSFKLAYLILRHGKYVSRAAFLWTWLPFSTLLIVIIISVTIVKLS